MNEMSGAVKREYKPFIHFPAGMWKCARHAIVISCSTAS
jgi:hypothetical protein